MGYRLCRRPLITHIGSITLVELRSIGTSAQGVFSIHIVYEYLDHELCFQLCQKYSCPCVQALQIVVNHELQYIWIRQAVAGLHGWMARMLSKLRGRPWALLKHVRMAGWMAGWPECYVS